MSVGQTHYVTVIENEYRDVYDGPRAAVFHDEASAVTDLIDWIEDELGETFGTTRDPKVYIRAYAERKGFKARIEEQLVF